MAKQTTQARQSRSPRLKHIVGDGNGQTSATTRKTPKAPSYETPTRWLKIATELLALPTSPFHEHNVHHYIHQFARMRKLGLEVDAVGNLLISYPNVKAKPELVFSAHTDHPGFWAIQMLGPRELEAHWMGGVRSELFENAKVAFWTGGEVLDRRTRNLFPRSPAGFRLEGQRVAGRVVEVLTSDQRGRPQRVRVKVAGEVLPGSIGMWDLPDPAVRGGKLYARGIDDVAGVASLLCMLDELASNQSKHAVTCIFTRAEEGGFFGCIDACQRAVATGEDVDTRARLLRDVPIVGVETSMMLPHAPQGDGPIIRVGDRTHLFDQQVTAWMSTQADALHRDDPTFKFQRRLMDGGTCESSVYVAYGLPAGGLCVALGNYHNMDLDNNRLASEYINIEDFGNLIRLHLKLVDSVTQFDRTGNAFRTWCDGWHAKHSALFSAPAGSVA